jgi:hypothetical protein
MPRSVMPTTLVARTRALVGVVCLATAAACQVTASPPVPQTGLDADIAYLASRKLAGREAGTRGGDSAAAFVARRYQQLGLRALFPGSCPDATRCPPLLFQFFRVRAGVAQNVAAVVDGTDVALRDQYVVIGAHYDHLGFSNPDALDPEAGMVMHPGADDNASGTAAVLELARRFMDHPARRSVLVVNFDAEELGLVGSQLFVAHPPVPLASIRLMLNLDMIGRLRDDRLMVAGGRNDVSLRPLLDSSAATRALKIEWTSALDDRSDQASFAAEHVPTVALFTGFHYDYHRASDIPIRINSEGLGRIVDMAETLVRGVADR